MRDRPGPRESCPVEHPVEQGARPPGDRRRVPPGEPAPLSRGRSGDTPGSQGAKERGREGGADQMRDRRAGEGAQAPRMRRARPETGGRADGKAAADAWRRAQAGRTGRRGHTDQPASAGASAADRKPTYRPWFASTRDSAPWFTEEPGGERRARPESE